MQLGGGSYFEKNREMIKVFENEMHGINIFEMYRINVFEISSKRSCQGQKLGVSK